MRNFSQKVFSGFAGKIGIVSLMAICFALFGSSVNSQKQFVSNSKAGRQVEISAPQVSTTIVISQFYGGGGGTTGTYKNDYIELHNVSSSPVSLNGLAIQYGSATGQFGSSPTNIFALPNVTLQPGQFYLVQLGATGTGGADLPVTPDVVTTNISASGTSGKVALTNTTTALGCGATATPCTLPDSRIIDEVSYGTANNAEGGTSANNGVAITSTQGVVRIGSSCVDTDNNNADFTVVTNPVPRNSASALAPCGTTAATVNVGGRVTNSKNRGIARATVSMIDGNGNRFVAYTNSFGYYRFDDVEVGQTLIFDVRAKGYNFTQPTQLVSLNEEATTIDFKAYESRAF